jgi:hypothetical protein
VHRHEVRAVLNRCANVYEERAAAYAPDPNFPEEALSMTTGFMEDMYGARHAAKHSTRYVLASGAPDELALWANVGQKIARLRTRGVPGYGEENGAKEEFIDDAEDLIVFLAMGICKVRDTFQLEGEDPSIIEEFVCGHTG